MATPLPAIDQAATIAAPGTTRSRRRRQSRSTRTRSRLPRRPSTPRRSRSRSMSTSRRRSCSKHRWPSRLSPCSLHSHTASRDDADRALEAKYPAMGSSKGDYLPRSRATLKPYCNLKPDIKRRARERRSRRDLYIPEHMCGVLFMCLKAIDPLSEVYAAVQHAAQVAQDTMTIQWPTVRAWLQACFSHVENSGASWHDSARGALSIIMVQRQIPA